MTLEISDIPSLDLTTDRKTLETRQSRIAEALEDSGLDAEKIDDLEKHKDWITDLILCLENPGEYTMTWFGATTNDE